MTSLSKNGKAHVLEISNRASIQTINIDAVTTINTRIDNHIGILNTNAHEIQNIFGLENALNGKEPVISVKNTAFNKNFGNTSDNVCQGNDTRLSDARTPLAHIHAISDVTGLQTALDGKQATISGATGSFTYIKTVNFAGQSVTTGTIAVANGIITSIS